MDRWVNIFAVIGSLFLILNFFHFVPNNFLLYLAFLFYGTMNLINAKVYKDQGETSWKVWVILLCALVLLCASAAGFYACR